MPLPVSGQVGPQQVGDGVTTQPLRQGRTSEAVITELHGKYYEQTFRGNLFHATTPAAGAAIPIFSNVIQQFLVWNPANSAVNMVPIRVILGYVSAAFVPGHLCIGHSLTTQAQPGTTTAAFISNGKVGSTGPGKVSVFTPGTVATALTYYRALNLSVDTAVAASTNAPWTFAEEFDGTLIVPPGGLMSIAANVAQTAICTIALIYEEVAV